MSEMIVTLKIDVTDENKAKWRNILMNQRGWLIDLINYGYCGSLILKSTTFDGIEIIETE